MGNKYITIVRIMTRKLPFLYGFLGNSYHNFIFYIEHIRLRMEFPRVKHIKVNKKEIFKSQQGGYKSQYGQEKFLLDNNYIPSKGGHFVDIGCNHPINCSNSFALEKKCGYTGLAIDPLTIFISMWEDERPKTTFVNKFLSSDKKKVEFVEVTGNEGWEHMLSGENSSVRIDGKNVKSKVRDIETLPLQDVLDGYGYDANIDVMFIDVEGHEHEVIEGVDWNRTKPNVIVIENFGSFHECNRLRLKLMNVGYDFIARIGISDDIFILKSKLN